MKNKHWLKRKQNLTRGEKKKYFETPAHAIIFHFLKNTKESVQIKHVVQELSNIIKHNSPVFFGTVILIVTIISWPFTISIIVRRLMMFIFTFIFFFISIALRWAAGNNSQLSHVYTNIFEIETKSLPML